MDTLPLTLVGVAEDSEGRNLLLTQVLMSFIVSPQASIPVCPTVFSFCLLTLPYDVTEFSQLREFHLTTEILP